VISILAAISVAAIWGKAWKILLAILFFGIIVMIHEFGHFSTAKLFKVKVNEFALGMGPAIFKKRRGETLYAIRLFPIGGYVSMEGEDEESEDERAFNRQKVWKRFIIVAAGAIMNIILGLIIVAVMLSTSGELIGTNRILSFSENAVSRQNGLREGDRFVKIDGHRLYSEMDLMFLLSRSEDGVYDLVVERDGKNVKLDDLQFETHEVEGVTVITYDFTIIGEKPNFFNIFTNTFKESASIVRLVRLSLFDLVTGRYGLSDLSGPVGTINVIVDATEEATSDGDWYTLLLIMALITINIGVFNLLPLPALDGGRLFFMLIEMIRRKPIKPKYEGMVHAIGLALLLILMAVVTFSDIMKLVK
jgi:regulator of sigma E protease